MMDRVQLNNILLEAYDIERGSAKIMRSLHRIRTIYLT